MRALVTLAVLCGVTACKCEPTVAKLRPSLGVSPTSLDFHKVKVGSKASLTLQLESRNQATVEISSITIEGPAAAAFRLGTLPTKIEGLGSTASLEVTFTPPAEAALNATLVIKSNDVDVPTVKLPMVGEGAVPKFQVTPDCQTSRGCTGMVVVDPPSIDFGREPRMRAVPLDPTKLPTLVAVNAGDVPLQVTSFGIRGADATAFSFANGSFPDGGVKLEASGGFNVPIRFTPTSAGQTQYAAEAVLTSDDPEKPSVTVALAGSLKPNEAPNVCANLVRVVPQAAGETPRDYGSATEWATLTVPPSGGYDFTLRRDVRPKDLVVLSALSDPTATDRCTNDPEDGRTGLTYLWQLTSRPAGAQNVALAGATTPQVQLRPTATGLYVLELGVTDAQGARTVVTMRFAVAIKQDFVAQLEWPGFAGVDLDLHLVRPSAVTGNDAFTGAFTFYNAPATSTSGDLNGYSRRIQEANAGAGYDFDWGEPGAVDDPTLNVDDRGDGELLENASLNYPEHDPLCQTASCTYRVMVHVFNDARVAVNPPACVVDGGVGCLDGEACSCATGSRCVAESAPVGSPARGSGKCYEAPRPMVRLFFFGSPTPAKVIPLDTLAPPDSVELGSPCTMWHVADVAWPARTQIGSLPDGGTPPPVVTTPGADGTGRVVTPSLARFGRRQTGGSLQCSPDSTQGAIDWYSRQP